MKLNKSILLLLAAILMVFVTRVSTASAQGPFPAPTNVVVRDGANPGDVVISWNCVPSANFYRIGWVAYKDYQAEIAAGRPWLEAFTFIDVANRGQISRTVRT